LQEFVQRNRGGLDRQSGEQGLARRQRPIFKHLVAWRAASTHLKIAAAPSAQLEGRAYFIGCFSEARIVEEIVENITEDVAEKETTFSADLSSVNSGEKLVRRRSLRRQ
jgi:hypothetical protein